MSARRGVILILGICILVLPSPSGVAGGQGGAGERITRYHSEVEVGRDGALTVTETIAVRAEGRQIRRGIYRDFPTRYRDRLGNRVTARFEVLEVRRNGRPEQWFTERLPNGVRINTGGDDLLPVPGEHTYTIRYRTERQLGFFAEHDELYWNVTGTGWDFAIDRASAEVRLPEPVAAEDLRIDLYTGAQGTQGRDARAEVPAPGLVRVATTAPLGPREGLTIAVGFPKGIVREPTRADRLGWLLYDNRGLLIVLAGLVLVLLFYLWRWQRRGRDPRAGTVIPEYEPPAGHPPAGLRYLWRMRYDDRCFAADLVEMGVAGHLRIHREGSGAAERWRVERLAVEIPGDAPASQRALHRKLFEKGAVLEMESGNATRVSGARTAHQKALKTTYQPTYFVTNAGTVVAGMVASGFILGLALVVARGDGIPGIILAAGLLVGINLLFAFLMHARTPAGRRLLDAAEGLRLYLSVAEREELARLGHGPGGEPSLDPERYERLLPYALALDVEDAWTDRFTSAVGRAAAESATRNLHWYQGSGARLAGVGGLGTALGRDLSGRIASSASPPGSSSGGGGGGFSGGGGGGGGGGGR
jgi:uncharacterized membrane protein YgcG